MNETVVHISAIRLIHICLLKLSKIISKKKIFYNFVYLYNFFSYLDIFSLDDDSFGYRNVDYLNKLDHHLQSTISQPILI